MTKKLIQSYVWHNGKCFFISTINRESSALLAYGMMYAETMVWEYNYDTSERGKLIGEYSGSKGSLRCHFNICENLQEHGTCEDRQ